jgi:NACalpha-BTF3-like transcription factor
LSNDTSIFNTTATPVEAVSPVVPPQTSAIIPPEVAEYVGTGKKYQSVEEALKSVPHAQTHILTLTEELKAAKLELEKRRTAENLLEEMRNNSVNKSNETQTQVAGLTQEDVARIVQQTFVQNEQQTQAKTNTESVRQAFSNKFGDKAEEFYIQVAKESGIALSDLNRLSATSPSAVLKLAGIETKKVDPVVSKPTSSINTESLNNKSGNQALSARVKQGASTKDLVAAWKIAGQKIGKPE